MARALVTLIVAGGVKITPPATFDPESVGITPEELRALVASGYAEDGGDAMLTPAPEPAATPEPTPEPAPDPEAPAAQAGGEEGEPADPEERREAIQEAMELLEPGNTDHWTNAGKPDVYALADVLGWRPSASERDKAVA